MAVLGVDVWQLCLAGVIAATVTGLELITTEYPRTSRFVLPSPWFWGYVVIYGALAVVALTILPLITNQVTVDGVGLSNPWLKAAFVGFSVKAFLHVRLFTVSRGPGDQFPVGLETFVQLFEPWFLSNLQLDHYFREMEFVTPRAQRCADLATAQTRAKANIPPAFKSALRTALRADVDQETTREGVVIVYLTYCGMKLTSNAFP
jgi:hypothetical protein